jgi:AcrR family transcriptional regulator
MSKKPGLREKKQAKTRLKLAYALVRRLQQSTLDQIVVRDLCDDIEISEATFFNYFPRKLDLLDYYTQLWMLDLNWRCRNADGRGLAAIRTSFDLMAQAMQKQAGVMSEIIARQALAREKSEPVEISPLDRQLAYPDHAGIGELPAGGIDKVWLPALEQAIRDGELPPNTHLPTVMIGLASLFYGVPLVLRQSNISVISSMYHQQLALFWAGVRAATMGSS